MDNTPISGVPLVGASLAGLQVFLYFMRGYLGVTSDEDVFVSWKTIVEDQQFWRLFIAQYFTFSKVPLFVNCFALITLGRYLEKKINTLALLVIIQCLGVTGNILYLILNPLFCSGPLNEHVHGFNMIIIGLRMISIFVKDLKKDEEKDLLFGFFPVNLPSWLVPWQVIIEATVFDVFVMDRCILTHIIGVLCGSTFPFIAIYFDPWVLKRLPALSRSVFTITDCNNTRNAFTTTSHQHNQQNNNGNDNTAAEGDVHQDNNHNEPDFNGEYYLDSSEEDSREEEVEEWVFTEDE